MIGLKKNKPNNKIKLFDSYKVKEIEEDIDNKDFDNSEYNNMVMKLIKRKSHNELKKKRVFQKEKWNVYTILFSYTE